MDWRAVAVQQKLDRVRDEISVTEETVRSLIACQDWLPTDMPLLTELLATLQTREEASPVRGRNLCRSRPFRSFSSSVRSDIGFAEQFSGSVDRSSIPLPTPSTRGEGEDTP